MIRFKSQKLVAFVLVLLVGVAVNASLGEVTYAPIPADQMPL